MDLGLRGKVAVITGASIGIGLAVAEGLAAEGVHIVIAARQEDRLKKEGKRIAKKHTLAVVCDIATAKGADKLIAATTKEFKGADILINNAGTGSDETIMEAPDDKWQHYWDLHVMTAVRLARGLAPTMKKRGGGVVLNNASICAVQPLWYEPIYNVTKSALMMFSKVLATEVIKDNIRVNCINPGSSKRQTGSRRPSNLRPTRAATGRATFRASPTSTPPSNASAPRKNSPTSSCSSAPTRPPTASAPPTSSTAAC